MGKDVGHGDAPDRERPRGRRAAARGGAGGWLSRWYLRLSLVVLAGLWVWALAWVMGGVSWLADLLANLAAQGLVVTAAAAVVWTLTGRRVLMMLALLACAMHVWILGTGRATLMPREFESSGRVPGAVRLFHYNASHKRPPEQVLGLVAETAPDVVSIAEPSVPLQMMVIHGDALEDVYPFRLRRLYRERGEGDRVGAGVLLSKWPLESYPIDDVVAEGVVEDLISGVLTVPGGTVGATEDQRWGVIAVHPRSPRTAERWAHGNEVTRATAAVARKMQREGLPVVVLADLNSTPSGWRSRELFFEADLRRGKPLLAAAGTYPAVFESARFGSFRAWWPGTIAIDDVFVSGGLHVRGWMRLDPTGSDHWPVLAEIVPAGR